MARPGGSTSGFAHVAAVEADALLEQALALDRRLFFTKDVPYQATPSPTQWPLESPVQRHLWQEPPPLRRPGSARTPIATQHQPMPVTTTLRPQSARRFASARRTIDQMGVLGLNIADPLAAYLSSSSGESGGGGGASREAALGAAARERARTQSARHQFAPTFTRPVAALSASRALAPEREVIRGAERTLLSKVLAAPFMGDLTEAGVAAYAAKRAREFDRDALSGPEQMILDAAGATHDVKTAARIAAAPDYLQADIRAQQQASAQLGALMDAADAAIAEVAVPLSGTRRGPGGAASKKTAIKLSRLATRQAKAKRSAIVSQAGEQLTEVLTTTEMCEPAEVEPDRKSDA